jgi:hypothetical protein
MIQPNGLLGSFRQYIIMRIHDFTLFACYAFKSTAFSQIVTKEGNISNGEKSENRKEGDVVTWINWFYKINYVTFQLMISVLRPHIHIAWRKLVSDKSM